MKYVRGIEYKCDGVKPEGLAGNVIVKAIEEGYGSFLPMEAWRIRWDHVSLFTIVDQRPEFDPEPVMSEWYDYLNQCHLAKPPLNIMIERAWQKTTWNQIVIKYIGKHKFAYELPCGTELWGRITEHEFRPLDYNKPMANAERNKLSGIIEAAEFGRYSPKMTADMIIKAGWTRK